eukprot:scaffold9087_cov119-Isochrysis_galbana.AAC.9
MSDTDNRQRLGAILAPPPPRPPTLERVTRVASRNACCAALKPLHDSHTRRRPPLRQVGSWGTSHPWGYHPCRRKTSALSHACH